MKLGFTLREEREKIVGQEAKENYEEKLHFWLIYWSTLKQNLLEDKTDGARITEQAVSSPKCNIFQLRNFNTITLKF